MTSDENETAEDKLDPETAEIEFNRFAESMDLDLNPSEMDADDEASFTREKNRLIKALRNGSLIVNDDGEMVYTPQRPKSNYKKPITFNERSGKSNMAMDKRSENQMMRKTYDMMGIMCKVPPQTFVNLVGVDIKICEGIFKLLMG